MSVRGQRSCICLLGVRGLVFVVVVLSILPLSTILIFDFRIVTTVGYFWFSSIVTFLPDSMTKETTSVLHL